MEKMSWGSKGEVLSPDARTGKVGAILRKAMVCKYGDLLLLCFVVMAFGALVLASTIG